MKVLVAGATGAIGRQLVPRLVAAGHDVAGITRSRAGAALVRRDDATPFAADALDADAVASVVATFEPEVIVHELTALKKLDMRHFQRSFAATNRLRTEATDHLLAAGRAVGIRRFVAQSFAGWPSGRVGPPVATEEEPLDAQPAPSMRTTLDAIRHLETAVIGAEWTEGVVLRYGNLYGPGTSFAPGGATLEAIRAGGFPIVGDAGGVWSFVHVADAVEATVIAVERGRRGVYQVVDDEPAPVAEWLPTLAHAIGARPPRRVPRWIGRLLAGEAATIMMTEVRGASNEKAKRELRWQPRFRTWRDGLLGGDVTQEAA
jgi:nucleoside-diphosphate-sugar epimerase